MRGMSSGQHVYTYTKKLMCLFNQRVLHAIQYGLHATQYGNKLPDDL